MKRHIGKGYVRDSYKGRREYTVFFSDSEITRIFKNDSPLEEIRTIIGERYQRGFLSKWAVGEINANEWRALLMYGPYPGKRTSPLSEETFDQYMTRDGSDNRVKGKITGIRIIWHPGGY